MQAIDQKIKPDPKAKKPLANLKRGDASLLELNNSAWRVVVNDDVTPQELDLHPTFFSALADEVREGDSVKALWNSGRYVAQYEIVNVQNGTVAARLAYACEGAPVMSAIGPKAMPAGYVIVKAKLEEGNGFVVVRESDGMRIMNSGGVPWKSYQDAYEQFPKLAMFRGEQSTRYVP